MEYIGNIQEKRGIKFYKSDIISIIIVLLTLSSLFIKLGLSFFSYIDEGFALIGIVMIFFGIINNRYNKIDVSLFILIIGIVAIGVISNYIYGYQIDKKIIMLDILATTKGFIYYLAFRSLKMDNETIKRTIKRSSYLLFVYMLILLPFCILNFFVNIGMSSDIVFGIKGFKFIYVGEGEYSLPFYVIVFVGFLNFSLNNQETLCSNRTKYYNIIYFFLSVFLWLASLRSRAITFSIFAIFLYFALYKVKKSDNMKHVFIIILIGLIIAYIFGNDKLSYYFGNTNMARYNLLYYGFYSAGRFFPFGSGFATYGSDLAAEYYSPLYYEYGFNSIYGLEENRHMFANDGLWGEIFGQFGFFGAISFILIIILIFKECYYKNTTKYSKIPVLYLFSILIIGSLGSKTFLHYSIIPVFALLAIFSNFYLEKNEV